MDTRITPTSNGTWAVRDLLGRELGTIIAVGGRFRIDRAASTLPDVKPGPFDSIDLAMSEIERATRGVCQLGPGT